MTAPAFRESGATFSSCGQYRYKLWRRWDYGPMVAFILLNPSRATEIESDPTVTRCIRRAGVLGYGGMYVGNIFALRSTDPAALYSENFPIGPDNDDAIMEMARDSHAVVCGWGGGAHGVLHNRGERVREMLSALDMAPMCLGLTAKGHPRHPLYVPYSQPLVPYLPVAG